MLQKVRRVQVLHGAPGPPAGGDHSVSCYGAGGGAGGAWLTALQHLRPCGPDGGAGRAHTPSTPATTLNQGQTCEGEGPWASHCALATCGWALHLIMG